MEAAGERQPDRMYDHAAQLERTALAWNRTMLLFAVNGALLLKLGDSVGAWAVVAGSAILLLTLAGWLTTSRAYRRLRGSPAPALLAYGRRAWIVAGAGAGVGLADLLAVLAYP